MKRIKYWIMQLSIRKKLIFYSYLIVAPILLLISVLLFFYNYESAVESEENNCIQSVQGLSDSIEAMQKNIVEMGTYICINDEINQILTCDDPSIYNRDTQLWKHYAPVQVIQDMLAINGQIKTIAIYPENNVNPYLRCMDFCAYIGSIYQVRNEEIYTRAVKDKGKCLWQRV